MGSGWTRSRPKSEGDGNRRGDVERRTGGAVELGSVELLNELGDQLDRPVHLEVASERQGRF